MVCKYYLSIQTPWTSLRPHCLFGLRKELKFVLATHTDGRVWTRGGASVQLDQATEMAWSICADEVIIDYLHVERWQKTVFWTIMNLRVGPLVHNTIQFM